LSEEPATSDAVVRSNAESLRAARRRVRFAEETAASLRFTRPHDIERDELRRDTLN
jgi:hypothetical protein